MSKEKIDINPRPQCPKCGRKLVKDIQGWWCRCGWKSWKVNDG
jgi:hypothetical protein